MPTLLGPDGRPITLAKADLSREVAAPSLNFWRRTWRSPVARGLTPTALAELLDRASYGQPHDFLAFAEDLEERDPHYAGVLGIRKRAVLGLERHVESASDLRRDVKLRDAVEESLVKHPAFSDLLAGLLDGLAKGYAVVETVWDTRRLPWAPSRYAWRDPRWFKLDPVDGETLTLADAALGPGQPLPVGKFLIHRPRLKLGVAVRGGLARLVAAAALCRHIVLESWLSYCESYGAPARVAKADDRFFASDANPDQVAFLSDLQTKLATMLGADAHAVFPKSVDLELQEAAVGRAEVFDLLMTRLEQLISKAVLGRSDSADAIPGRLGGETQAAEVRQDILESDAQELAATINAQLVRPFVDWNFGPQAVYPRLILRAPEAEDLVAETDMLAKLVPLGLKVEQSVIRDKWGLPDPADGADVLGAPAPPESPASGGRESPVSPEQPQGQPQGQQQEAGAPAMAANRARNASPLPSGEGPGARAQPDPTAPLVDRLGAEADPLLNALLEPVRRLLAEAPDLETFRDGLIDLYPDLDPSAFAALMAQALAVADAAGRFEARPPPERAAARVAANAATAASAASAEAPPITIQFAPQIHVANQLPDQPPPTVHVSAPEVMVNNIVQVPDQPPPTVTVTADLAPPAVQITNAVQPAAVQLTLPARKTETTVERDRLGNIVRATQLETDLDLPNTGEPNP